MWGSRIIFAGPSKVFTQANKDKQRESNHAVYSLYSTGILGDLINYMNKRDVRFDSSGFEIPETKLINFLHFIL